MHYPPHIEVIREDHETIKLRNVFDALAEIRNEPSLNDILYSGPCLLLTERSSYSQKHYVMFYCRHYGRLEIKIPALQNNNKPTKI